MKNKLLILFLISFFAQVGFSLESTDALQVALDNAIKSPPQPKGAENMIVDAGDPLESCRQTTNKAVQECVKPSGIGFKEAAGILVMLPGVAAGFMTGGDPGKIAQMCKVTAAAGMLGGLLNGGQDKTCQNASAACQSKCGEAFNVYRQQEGTALSAGDAAGADVARYKQQEIQRFDKDCQDKVAAQMQLAKQQQMANQAPIAGAEACNQALNSDEDGLDDEIVDCSLAQYANYSECATIGKTDDGSGIPFEPGLNLTNDDEAIDLPEGEDREDFWNALKNKTAGAGGRSGGGAGAGAMGGGPGGGNGSGGNRAGGPMRKSGSSMVTGGNESSGGGAGWGKGDDGDFDKKFAKLGAKTNGLNMLKKKKIGGRNVASSEFGVASDDIWTRVYLRTNTRCTKQLAECAANKSLNPYGVNNKAR